MQAWGHSGHSGTFLVRHSGTFLVNLNLKDIAAMLGFMPTKTALANLATCGGMRAIVIYVLPHGKKKAHPG
jgi:hypothetical protein